VYVIRTNDLTDVDGALSLLNLEVLTKQSDAGKSISSMLFVGLFYLKILLSFLNGCILASTIFYRKIRF